MINTRLFFLIMIIFSSFTTEAAQNDINGHPESSAAILNFSQVSQPSSSFESHSDFLLLPTDLVVYPLKNLYQTDILDLNVIAEDGSFMESWQQNLNNHSYLVGTKVGFRVSQVLMDDSKQCFLHQSSGKWTKKHFVNSQMVSRENPGIFFIFVGSNDFLLSCPSLDNVGKYEYQFEIVGDSKGLHNSKIAAAAFLSIVPFTENFSTYLYNSNVNFNEKQTKKLLETMHEAKMN